MTPLPLICPVCWASDRYEHPMGDDLACSRCRTVFPRVDGVPVLLADAVARRDLAAGHAAADPRIAFYQRETEFLREEPTPRTAVRAGLALAATTGLVTEIGCGNGSLADLGGPDYVGLDYSLMFLRNYLEGRCRICATAEAVPLAGGSCRFVLTVAVLEHVPRADRAFGEIDRLLAAGGVAYVFPAWHCRDWACDGLPVRPYADLTWPQRLRKTTIPIRDSLLWRGTTQVPWRFFRRVRTAWSGKPSRLRFARLRANYDRFWMSDSDACSSIDSHEGLLFFLSRGYEILAPPGGRMRWLLLRGGPIVVRKPPTPALSR